MPRKKIVEPAAPSPQGTETGTEEVAAAVVRKRVAVRRVPQQARGQQTVQAVLRAAGEEIERAGLDHLSTKRIALAAGLSVGSLYGYFPNKESIIAALLDAWLGRVYEAVDSVHPRHGELRDVFHYLNEQLDRAMQVYEEQPGIGALFGTVMAIPVLHEMVYRHGERVSDSMASALSYFAPRAVPEDVRSVAHTIPLMCHHLMTAAAMDKQVDRRRMVADIRTCLVALGTRLLMPAGAAA